MARLGAVLIEALRGYGVDTVFGIPGNHTVELYRHLHQSGIRHVTTRHEQGAAFMADGYARATGRPGVCLLISGPGLLNAATGIAQAAADSIPLLILTGVAPRARLGLGHGTLHELPDQRATAAGFCRWSHTLLEADNLAEVLHRAFTGFACTRPGPVHVEIPLDLMAADCHCDPLVRVVAAPPAPDPDAIEQAAQRLLGAERPLILAGGGAIGAAAPLVKLAERLDAPVLNTVNGKGICPTGHPQAVGGSPSLPSLRQALASSDAVLAVGTELSETDYDLLMAGPPRFDHGLIRIDIDALQLTRNATAALPILADAGRALEALLRVLGPGGPGAGNRAGALREAVAAEPNVHAEMTAFFNTLADALPDATVMGDSTRPTYYAAWQYECPAPRRYFHSVTGFGTLGWAIPAALGARLALQRPVVALIGDGGAQFTWPELQTGAEQRLAVPVVVWRNDGYEEIANSMAGAGVDAASTRISAGDFQQGAAAHGCGYRRVRNPAELRDALIHAATHPAPTVIEAHQTDFLTLPSGGWYS